MLKRSDETILRLFNNSIKCSFLDKVMPAITYIGSTYFAITYCLVLFFMGKQFSREFAVKCSLSLILSSLLARIIKILVKRVRPFIALQNLNIKLIDIDKYSFPSGHTTSAFTLAIITALFIPSLALLCIGLSTLVGISRMYLGVHYPTDVIAGSIIGSVCSMLIYIL